MRYMKTPTPGPIVAKGGDVEAEGLGVLLMIFVFWKDLFASS